jgi:Cd(II)/Pb(II)-responsive transcriptional regulator
MRRSATACFGVTLGVVAVRMAMVVRFVIVAVAVAFDVGMLVMVVRFVTVAAAFAMLMSVFVVRLMRPRFVAVSAVFTMPMAVSIVTHMLVGMPFVPVGAGFGLFRAICFGEVGVWHGWLPGSICGLVNTLKPLQGQGRNPGGSMKIGELAKIAHCTTETIRFYEKEGLLPEAERTEANYRSYTAKHVERLRFIRNCRALDMTHDEIRALLRLTDAPADGCGSINALIDEHIAHVDTRIEELKQLKVQLTTLREQCHGEQAVEDCGIVQGLNEMDVSATRVRHTHLG